MLYEEYQKAEDERLKNYKKEVGKRVRECRKLFTKKNHVLSQGDFYIMLTGEKAYSQSEIDNFRQIVRRWEAGETLPPLNMICKMCDLSGWEADYFLCRIDKHTHERNDIFNFLGIYEIPAVTLSHFQYVSNDEDFRDYSSVINAMIISKNFIPTIGNIDLFLSNISEDTDGSIFTTHESDCYEYRAIKSFRNMLYDIAKIKNGTGGSLVPNEQLDSMFSKPVPPDP